jgi:phosphoenolpyruvate carboxylase
MHLYRRDVQEDINELGTLLGEVLLEQHSEEAFEMVESLRKTAITNRTESSDRWDSLTTVLDGTNEEDALIIARAFTNYFELINMAEDRERIRALREQTQAGNPDGGLEEIAQELATVERETAQQILNEVFIQPTFTAHPTEARRKTVKAKLQSVASDLKTLDEQLLTDKEKRQVKRNLRAEITSLWQTPQTRDRKPEPLDEALNVQWYLENVLFDVVGELYEELETALDEHDTEMTLPQLIEFRSWAGGDRDGNPYVTPEVTTKTLERQRETVLQQYHDQLENLAGILSHDTRRIELGDEIESSLATDRERLPSVAEAAVEEYPNEPYRQKLKLMSERLSRVQDPRSGGYSTAAELEQDLADLEADLSNNNAESIATAHVSPLIRAVETFGFNMASLDLRDHQANHTKALVEAFAREGTDYESLDEAARVEFLTDAILADESLLDLRDTEGLGETATRVFARFDHLADWQREYGIDAIDTYCISMCEEPSHVLEVLFLASEAGVVNLPEHSGLDIVPLLETEYALSGARRIMGTLFENAAYKAAVSARGNIQEIMLGYSDSNKENGYLAAQWSLYRNQKRLAEICEDYEMELRLFHGRGGSISRGGGSMHDAMLALPNETITGQIKFTEQGEAISEKYGDPIIAERELEQMVNAQVRARLDAVVNPIEPIDAEWTAAMETAADAARDAYRDLIESDGFIQYFEQATPITVIEDLNLGSRPASRSGDRTVEDLRAIPWVFAWTQARCIIPGWYSLATGLQAYIDAGGSIDTLREMYQEWPFFQTLIENAALALGRTDMKIATRYANLSDEDLRESIFGRIQAEYEAGVDLVLEVTDRETLLGGGWLEESLARRNPYVDPLNLLQLRLLDTENRSDLEEETLRVTVKGIAAGMKNTG